MMEVDTKGWIQAEEALAEVVLWGVARAIETPAKLEARCHYHSWIWVVLEMSPHSIEENPCVLLQPPRLPSGSHCFQSFVPTVVLLLLMMLVWVEAHRAEDCPACDLYAYR